MESDTDSEVDRHAYGQYTTLAVEGDTDVDPEAAAYLRSVREEAAALPDVVTAEYSEHKSQQQKMPSYPASSDRNHWSLVQQGLESVPANIRASQHWIQDFMEEFATLRTSLQRLEIASNAEDEGSNPLDGKNAFPSESSPLPDGLQELLAMNPAVAAQRFEDEVEDFLKGNVITVIKVYNLYSLAAILDHPLSADAEASMGRLFRHCIALRTVVDSEIANAFLDILQVISGAYFGQDGTLRNAYRQHGLHV